MTLTETIDAVMAREKIAEKAVETRRYLHRHAELSGKEYGTMKLVAERLAALGIPCRSGVADTGVVGLLTGDHPGPVIGLRADMDALPIQEENPDLPYASENPGVMHACGHDAHTAILLGTAELLANLKDELHGSVKFFFQPAEEAIGGAERMIAEGVLEDPKVDAVFGLHVNGGLKPGQIGIKYGQTNAATDAVTVRVYGKSCHAAHPHKGVDAILIAAHILTACQSIVSRNVSPTDSAVCSFGTIRGGNVSNQVADFVEMTGTLRTLSPETRLFVRERIKAVCEQTAALMGGRAECRIRLGYSPLINDDAMADQVRDNAAFLLGKDQVIIRSIPSLGGEDFAYFAEARPSCFFQLGSATDDPRQNVGHSCHFNLNEDCIPVGIRLQALNVLRFQPKKERER